MGVANTLMRAMMKQFSQPAGWLGGLVAWEMNSGHARVTEWGLKHASVGESDTILDVGCGGGATVVRLSRLATRGKVYGIDCSDRSVSISKRTSRRLIAAGRAAIGQGAVSYLPFTNETFDLVTAVETHYFWPDLVADMREVLRVLKPGGKLLIIGEAYRGARDFERDQKWIELGAMTIPSLPELVEAFASAGYADAQMFEEQDRGWFCGTGTKPSTAIVPDAPTRSQLLRNHNEEENQWLR